MSKFTTYANGQSVAGKATKHVATNLSACDENWTPDKKKIGIVNHIKTEELDSGQTGRTFLQGKPVWTAAGKLDASDSKDAHPGTKGGAVSGKYLKQASAITFSANVLIEGNGVVRYDDDTWQNAENSRGKVKDADELADILAKNPMVVLEEPVIDPPAPPPPDPKKNDKDKGKDKTGEEVSDGGGEGGTAPTDAQCYLVQAVIKDGNRRDNGYALEIVGNTKLSCEATVQGTCADGRHPHWQCATASPTERVAAKTTLDIGGKDAAQPGLMPTGFRLDTLPGNAARIGLNAWWAVQDAKPVEHTVRIECHTGTPNAKSFKVSQYTPDTVTIPDLESLFTIFDTIGDALKLGEKMGSSKGFGRVYPQEGIAIGKPSVDMECAWKEWTDWRAYFAFVIKLKMDPCITAYVKMFIPWPPPAVWVQTLLRKIGVNAGPYIRLEGGIGWNLDAERRSPDGDWGVSLTVSPFFGVRAGIEVSAGTKFYADASGQAKLTVPLKFYSPKLLRPLYLDVGQLKIASIKMVAVIAVSGGWAVDLAARAVGAKKHIYHGVEEGKVYGQEWDAGFSDGQTVYAADVELQWEDIKFFAPKTFNLLSA